MRWEGRRQSDNIEDRRGMRVSRGGLVGGGLGTLAIALLVMFLGGDPTPVLQGAGQRAGADDQRAVRRVARRKTRRDFVGRRCSRKRRIVWTRAFAAIGGQYQEPTLVFFREAVESGCGFADSGVGPFYCPPDEGVYIDLSFFDEMAAKLQRRRRFRPCLRRRARGRPPRAEPARAFPSACNSCASASSEAEANQLSVRLELQADCFAGIWANYADKHRHPRAGRFRGRHGRRIAPSATTRLQRSAGRMVVPDSFTHGTSEQRQRWFRRGIRDGFLRRLRHLQGGRPLIVHLHPVPEAFAARAVVKAADYRASYEESIRDPEGFWAKVAKRIDWYRFPTRIKDVSFDPEDFRIRWYEDGELNVSVNCLDRQLAKRADKTALLFEGDDPAVSRRVSYRELYEEVCRFGNALRRLGVKKGDRVTIYMPMIPEAAVAMLACARVGAVHSVVFGGFSPESLAGRIADCASTLVITADEGVRGGRKIPLKANVDAAIAVARAAGEERRRRAPHGRGRRLGRRPRPALRGHHGRGACRPASRSG